MIPHFYEVQRFNQRWLWVILILMMLTMLGIFGYGFIQQLVFGIPFGDRPVSDKVLVISGSLILLFSGGLVYIFYTLRLITEVRTDGVYLRFYPFWSKVIPYADITSCNARQYKPLREYGGWGIKYGPSGWAYNISGDRGAQLELKNGKRILIGSQRADDLAQAINAARPAS